MSEVAFDISSALLTKGVGKSLKPDRNGVYHDIPLLVIGKVSRNGKEYDVESMLSAIRDKGSMFYTKLVSGQLEGEWSHPLAFRDEEVGRIAVVDRTRVSHQIHRVYTGETTSAGHTIVYGDVEPCGPYGSYLKESLENPRKNTAFSLRSLVSVTGQDGPILKQRVNALVTIDAVDCPGYSEASKVNVSTEGYQIRIDPNDHVSEIATLIGAESLYDQQLLDILQVDKVTINTRVRRRGVINAKRQTFGDETGEYSLFHELFR